MRDLSSTLNSIHTEIGLLDWVTNQLHGYFDQVDAQTARGLFIHPESTEAIRLDTDVRTLRRLAAQIEQRKTELLKNMKRSLHQPNRS
jgi:hypothetical protein